jgi:saccharopine dehydrogenase (NAD+, L-lysine-forming)
MVRFAAPYFDRLEKANVGSYINIDWTKLTFSDATRIELIGEMKNYRMDCFKDGEWQKGNWKNARKFDFRNGFGVKSCYPMFLEELRQLPEMIPSLKETGFFASGFSWFVTLIVLPVCLMGSKLLSEKSLRPLGKFLEWGFKVSSKPPFVTILLLEASGWKREQYQTLKVKIAHESGYVLTAVPAVACILQYLDGSIKKPGLFLQANIVEPKRFLEDMKRMGIEVEIDDSEFK